MKKPKLPKILNPKANKVVKTIQRVVGFEKCEKEKFLKSPELDEIEVAVTLVRLTTDMNWVKRLLWLLVCGGGAGFYFS